MDVTVLTGCSCWLFMQIYMGFTILCPVPGRIKVLQCYCCIVSHFASCEGHDEIKSVFRLDPLGRDIYICIILFLSQYEIVGE